MPTILAVILSIGAACVYALAGPMARIFIRFQESQKPMPKITGFHLPEDSMTEQQVISTIKWGSALCLIGWWIIWAIIGGE